MTNIYNDNIAETVCTDTNHEIENTDKTGIGTAKTLRYIGSNQEKVPDNCEDITMNQLKREDTLVQRNCVEESHMAEPIHLAWNRPI